MQVAYNSQKHVRAIPGSMMSAIEKILGIHSGHGILNAGGVAAIVFLVLFAIGSYGTFKTGFKGIKTADLTDEMTAHLQNLPDKWRTEADRRFKAGEISGYERQIEHRRAEAIRQKAEIAAVQIHQMGNEKAKKLMKSAFVQAVGSVLFSSIAPLALERAASSANPTLIKKAGVLMIKKLGKFGTKALTKGTLKGIDVAQSLIVDQAVSVSMDIATGKAPQLEKEFLDQHLGLMKLHKELQDRLDNDLMRAHMASVISALEQTQQKDPDGYDNQVQKKAAHLDHFLSLTEQTQKSRGQRVTSPWRTVADLSDWMKVQVLAKQKADAEKQQIAVVSGEVAITVQLGVAPARVKPGESITIVVNPKVSGIKEGELKIEVAIDGKTITTKQHSGPLNGDLSQILRHPITKQFGGGGDHVVKVFAEVRSKPESKPLSATDTKSFYNDKSKQIIKHPITGKWYWTATCGKTKFEGTFTFGAISKDGSFGGSFGSIHVGKLKGKLQGKNGFKFTRSFGKREQTWFGQLTSSTLNGTLKDIEHYKYKLPETCTFKASQKKPVTHPKQIPLPQPRPTPSNKPPPPKWDPGTGVG